MKIRYKIILTIVLTIAISIVNYAGFFAVHTLIEKSGYFFLFLIILLAGLIMSGIKYLKHLKKYIIERRAIEEALTRSEHQLQLVTNVGPTLIAYVGADGRYVWVNKMYAEWFGLSVEKVRGRHMKEILGEEDWATARPYVEQVLAGETVVHEREVLYPGGRHWIHATFTPDLDSGHVRGFVVQARDITELKRTEANLLREKIMSESVINGLPGAFYLFDKSGRFLRWNQNLEKVSGYSPQEISTMNPLDFFRAEEKWIIANAILKTFVEGKADVEASIITKDGRAIPYYFVGFRMVIDGVPYLVGEGIDISERRKSGEALRLSEARFRTLFEQSPLGIQILSPLGHTLQVNHAWEKLWDLTIDSLKDYNILQDRQLIAKGIMPHIRKGFAGEAVELPVVFYEPKETVFSGAGKWVKGYIYPIKEETSVIQVVLMHVDVSHIVEFGYDVAHELKSPLAIIRGELEMAEMKECQPENYKRMITVGLEETQRMLKTVEDLLLLSKLEYQTGVFKLEQLDFSELARKIFEQLKKLAEPKNIEATLSLPDEPIHISADSLHLSRLFMNLVSNAVKFTPEKGKINFVVNPPDKTQLTVSVSDTGIGIDQEDISKIFERRFHGGHRTGKVSEGIGLGLNIAQSIAKIHGGAITVESKPGNGSTFIVNLPLAK